MPTFRKGVTYLLLCLSFLLFSISAKTQTQATDKAPLPMGGLAWLARLNINLARLQPDINCPNNQIKKIQANKTAQLIESDIGSIEWDIDCASKAIGATPEKLSTSQEQLIQQILKQLRALPKTHLRIKKISVLSSLIKTTFSASLYGKKNNDNLFVTLHSDLINIKLSLDLVRSDLQVDAVLQLDKLPDYIELGQRQQDYLNNELLISYKSQLTQWQQGVFNLAWQGQIKGMSDDASLSMVGAVDLLKKQLSLSQLSIDVKQINVQLSKQKSWQVGYIKTKLSAPATINYGKFEIISLPLHLRVGKSLLLSQVERGNSKRVRIEQQKLPPLFMQIETTAKTTDVQFDWVLSLLNQKLNGKIKLSNETISLLIADNQINLKILNKAAKPYLRSLELLSIDQGTLNLALAASYKRATQQSQFETTLLVVDVAGKNADVLFDGVELQSQLNYAIDTQRNITINSDKQLLKIANLFVGFPIQALQIDAQVNAGIPVIQHFKARLLGGRVDFDDFKLIAPSQTVLNIAGISLAEVIKYSAYPEIMSKGLIDGMLPLLLTKTGPSITDGMIFARPPGGYIKVPENTVTNAMGRGNPAFSFTMQLLSNFQFDTLQGIIGYTSDGESDLAIAIKGTNPNVSGTQAINFNYSHHENILKLLKSLRFSDQLVRDIKERY